MVFTMIMSQSESQEKPRCVNRRIALIQQIGAVFMMEMMHKLSIHMIRRPILQKLLARKRVQK